jgi:hypothetical protein
MQADRGAQFVTGLDNSQYFMRHSAVNYKDRFYPNEEEDLMCDSGKYFYKLVGITNYYGPKENEEGQIYHYGEEGEDIGNNQSGNINGFTTQKEYEGDNTGNLNNSGTLRGKNKNIRGGNKVGNKNKAGAKGGKNNVNNNGNNNINIGGIGGMSEEEMSNQLMGQKRSNYKEDNITCTHSWKGNEEIPEIGVKSAVANVKFVWENGRRKKITTTVRTMINGEVNTEITKEDAF